MNVYLFQKQNQPDADPAEAELKHWPGLPLKMAVPLLILILILSAAFAYQRWNAARQLRLEGRGLPLPDLRPGSLELVRGTADRFPSRIWTLFQEDKLRPSLIFIRENPDDERSPYVAAAAEEREASWRERLLWGELALALRDEGNFLSWLEKEEAVTESVPAFSWQEKLGRVRLLFLAEQLFGSRRYGAKIDELSRELLPLFEKGPETQNLAIEEVRYPQVDAARQDEPAAREELSGIPFQSVDLWALKQLAKRDEQWQTHSAAWNKRAKEALLSSGFYAFAWDPQAKRCIPSAQATFQSDSLACLRQIRFLEEVGETLDLGLFSDLLLRDGTLMSAYHMASLTPLSEEADPAVLAEMLRLVQARDDRFMTDQVHRALELFRQQSGPEESLDLIFRHKDGSVHFELTDNVLALLAGALPDD